MPILITGTRLTLAKLADELLTSRATDTQRAAAAKALRDANPALSGQVASGTPVVLPELPHLRAKIDHVGILAGAERLGEVDAVLGPLPDALAGRAAAVKARATALKKELAAAPGLVPDATVRRYLTKNRLAAAQARGTAEAKGASDLAKAMAQAAPRWAEQVAELRALLLRTR